MNEYDFNNGNGVCNVCELALTSWQHAREHLEGRKHRNRRGLWEVQQERRAQQSLKAITDGTTPPITPSDDEDDIIFQGGNYWCMTCHVPLNTQEQLRIHTNSNKHNETKWKKANNFEASKQLVRPFCDRLLTNGPVKRSAGVKFRIFSHRALTWARTSTSSQSDRDDSSSDMGDLVEKSDTSEDNDCKRSHRSVSNDGYDVHPVEAAGVDQKVLATPAENLLTYGPVPPPTLDTSETQSTRKWTSTRVSPSPQLIRDDSSNDVGDWVERNYESENNNRSVWNDVDDGKIHHVKAARIDQKELVTTKRPRMLDGTGSFKMSIVTEEENDKGMTDNTFIGRKNSPWDILSTHTVRTSNAKAENINTPVNVMSGPIVTFPSEKKRRKKRRNCD